MTFTVAQVGIFAGVLALLVLGMSGYISHLKRRLRMSEAELDEVRECYGTLRDISGLWVRPLGLGGEKTFHVMRGDVEVASVTVDVTPVPARPIGPPPGFLRKDIEDDGQLRFDFSLLVLTPMTYFGP